MQYWKSGVVTNSSEEEAAPLIFSVQGEGINVEKKFDEEYVSVIASPIVHAMEPFAEVTNVPAEPTTAGWKDCEKEKVDNANSAIVWKINTETKIGFVFIS